MASSTSTQVTKAPCEAKAAMLVVLRQRLSDSSVVVCIRVATMAQRESKESCYFFSLFFFLFYHVRCFNRKRLGIKYIITL